MSDFVEKPVAVRLQELRARTPLSLAETAKAIGRPLSTYSTYERPDRFKKRYLPLELAEALAPVFARFGVDEQETLGLAGLQPTQSLGLPPVVSVNRFGSPTLTMTPPDEPQQPIAGRPAAREARAPAFDAPRASMVPLYAAAMAGDGETIVIEQGQEIEWIPASPAQLLAREAFSIRVQGDSMDPRYRHGEIVDVVKNRPPQNRQGVLIELKDGGALLKEWRPQDRENKERLVVYQYNPAENFEVERARVVALHAVVGSRVA